MRLRKFALSTFIAAAVSIGAGSAANAVNLLHNGSFETGSLSSWTLSGNTGANQGAVTSFLAVAPQNGSYMWSDGAIGSPAILSQTITDVVGQFYTATGWVNCSYGCFSGSLEGIGINPGSTPGSIPNSQLFNTPTTGANGWQQLTFGFFGTGTDTFSIYLRNDPSWSQADNFAVLGSAPSVPGPVPGAGLAGLAFLMLAGAMHRLRGFCA